MKKPLITAALAALTAALTAGEPADARGGAASDKGDCCGGGPTKEGEPRTGEETIKKQVLTCSGNAHANSDGGYVQVFNGTERTSADISYVGGLKGSFKNTGLKGPTLRYDTKKLFPSLEQCFQHVAEILGTEIEKRHGADIQSITSHKGWSVNISGQETSQTTTALKSAKAQAQPKITIGGSGILR